MARTRLPCKGQVGLLQVVALLALSSGAALAAGDYDYDYAGDFYGDGADGGCEWAQALEPAMV
jgi:hypothetical protein